MERARLTRTGRGQTLRLTTAMAFPDDVREVEVMRIGAALLLTPVGRRWDDFFHDGPLASPDYLRDRACEGAEERESL